MKSDPNPKERIVHQHITLSCPIDLLQATYYQQHFSRHTHDGCAFGIITSGQLDFSYRHKNWHALPGDINLVIPGEAHDGNAKDAQGWSYRMLYLPVGLLRNALYQRTGKDTLPCFMPGCISQSFLSTNLSELFLCLCDPALEPLQKESALLTWLIAFIEQYSDQTLPFYHLGQEPLAIATAKDYLHNHYNAKISLHTLSKITNLSPYHLLRAFEKNVGLPPHLYQQQLRIEKACQFLTAGYPLVQIAISTGFADQSHFTRQFKKIMGLTPAYYQETMKNRI